MKLNVETDFGPKSSACTPGKQTKRLMKNEPRTLKQTLGVKTTATAKKLLIFGDHRRQIAVFGSKLKLENGFWAYIECSHPESRPRVS